MMVVVELFSNESEFHLEKSPLVYRKTRGFLVFRT